MLLTGALLFLGLGHRSGRVPHLGRVAGFAERVSGLPGWAALPSAIATISLLTAFLGIPLGRLDPHRRGPRRGPARQPGPLPDPRRPVRHLHRGLPRLRPPARAPSRSAIRIIGDWYAPLGGVIISACGAFALIGFPLDDVWHRLFGQDVTLWGPTHLMLIGGAAMTLIGIAS